MCCSSVISTHSVYHRTGFIFNDSCLFKWVGLSVACKLSVTEEQSTIRDQIREIAKVFSYITAKHGSIVQNGRKRESFHTNA